MIVTVDEVKTYLYGTTVPASYNALFEQMIGEVEDEIKKFTGVIIGTETEYITVEDETRDGRGTFEIRAKFKPVRTLTKIEMKDSSFDWVEDTFEDVSKVDVDDGIFHTRYNYPEGNRNLRISYTAGYKIGEVPKDLKRCAIMMVISAFNKRESIGYAGQDVLDLSLTISNSEIIEIKKILNRYKNCYAY